MEAVRKLSSPLEGTEDRIARLRARTDAPVGAESLEKVLRFASNGREAAEPKRDEQPGLTSQDIVEAMNLVQSAAAAIRDAESRARDGEERAQTLLTRATEELKGAEERIQAAEARARAADARADAAEARAGEAEGWLRQIFATIAEELPAVR